MDASEGHVEGHGDDEKEISTTGPRPKAPPHVDATVGHLQHRGVSRVSIATVTTAK